MNFLVQGSMLTIALFLQVQSTDLGMNANHQ